MRHWFICISFFSTISHSAEITPPAFTKEIEIKAPTIDAPDLEDKLNTVAPHNEPLPAEHADMTAYRASQRRVAEERAKRKIKPLQYIDYSKQPQYAHHCVKLVFDAQHKPQLVNECQSDITIAYCWNGISKVGGSNECGLNQYALSHGGHIYGPDEAKAAFGLFLFACTSTGTPSDLRFNPDKPEIVGQCFW